MLLDESRRKATTGFFNSTLKKANTASDKAKNKVRKATDLRVKRNIFCIFFKGG